MNKYRVGNVAATLSWPTFVTDMFFSRSGTENPPTRDLGAVGGQVSYSYTAAVPEPEETRAVALLASIVAAVSVRAAGTRRRPCRGVGSQPG